MLLLTQPSSDADTPSPRPGFGAARRSRPLSDGAGRTSRSSAVSCLSTNEIVGEPVGGCAIRAAAMRAACEPRALPPVHDPPVRECGDARSQLSAQTPAGVLAGSPTRSETPPFELGVGGVWLVPSAARYCRFGVQGRGLSNPAASHQVPGG